MTRRIAFVLGESYNGSYYRAGVPLTLPAWRAQSFVELRVAYYVDTGVGNPLWFWDV